MLQNWQLKLLIPFALEGINLLMKLLFAVCDSENYGTFCWMPIFVVTSNRRRADVVLSGGELLTDFLGIETACPLDGCKEQFDCVVTDRNATRWCGFIDGFVGVNKRTGCRLLCVW